MVALATLDDVEALLPAAIPDSRRAAVQRQIEMASGVVVDHLKGQQLLPVVGDVLSMPAPLGWDFRLPQRPVTGITSITVNDILVDAADYNWWPSGKVTLKRWDWTSGFGDIWPLHSWGGPTRTIVITYDHGLDPFPDSVSLIVASMVANNVNNPIGLSSETVGGESSAYFARATGATSALSLSDADKRILRNYGDTAWTVDLGQ